MLQKETDDATTSFLRRLLTHLHSAVADDGSRHPRWWGFHQTDSDPVIFAHHGVVTDAHGGLSCCCCCCCGRRGICLGESTCVSLYGQLSEMILEKPTYVTYCDNAAVVQLSRLSWCLTLLQTVKVTHLLQKCIDVTLLMNQSSSLLHVKFNVKS